MDLTTRTHTLIREHFTDKDKGVAIDATCGNGFDTEFLARLGFSTVFGFDMQELAIAISQHRLAEAGFTDATLIHDGHESLSQYIHEPADCIMFNFGYLPGGDKRVTTSTQTSLRALQSATSLLNEGGLISLMCYPGHPAGALETKAIRNWFYQLDNNWRVETHYAKSPKPSAPILYLLKRITL